MKIALVHDYLLEYGGAEGVLRVLSEMYPDAPIYTAFVDRESPGGKKFADREIRESRYGWLIKRWRLYSPLRFLLPAIWRSIDLSSYDLVITSTSGYIARGFKTGAKTWVIAYCHTPPRFLYGYRTSLDWRKYWWARVYGIVVNTPLRVFDWNSAQEVDTWIANSDNVRKRILKFYRKSARVIYPPVDVEKFIAGSIGVKKQGYHLLVSRLVGAKGIEEAVEIAEKLEVNLKIVGESYGYVNIRKKVEKIGGLRIELLGHVPDDELIKLYAGAESFWALARDEDFGMTVVEAQASGTPVIAYKGGGFIESVDEGKTGVFVGEVSVAAMRKALKMIKKIKWDKKVLHKQARKFSREKFEHEMKEVIEE